jgi:hypothetical protein
MRATDFLNEGNNLATGELMAVRGGQPRYTIFLKKVKDGSPFTTKDGNPFIVDPTQYTELANFFQDPTAKGTLRLREKDTGNEIKNSELRKTAEFGGQQLSFDQTQPKGKEAYPAKPSQVFQTQKIDKFDPKSAKAVQQMLNAGAFYAGDLYDKIANSPILRNAGDFGQTVIDLASQLNEGQLPSLKEVNPEYAAAIRDYAGEFLGVQATMMGLADFPNQDLFFEFLGAKSLEDLLVFFPAATNNPLADSIAVQNKKTKHVINISSKGGKKGAPPSLDNLKVPDEFRNLPEFEFVVQFFDTARAASAKGQPFELMNVLFNAGLISAGENLPKYYDGLLPFSDSDISSILALMGKNYREFSIPKKFAKLLNAGKGNTGTPGGIIHYVVNKDMMAAVNGGAIPNFRELVLEILGYNFVQLFSDFKGREKQLYVRVLWPAKIDGEVEVYSKSYAAEPGKAKLSFSIT